MRAFSEYHPTVLTAYFLSVLLIAMFTSNPVMACSALLGGVLFCATLTTRQERKTDLGFYLPLMLLIAITNPLFSHNGETPLFFMNGNAVTLEAIVYGAALAVMVASVMLWCKSYSLLMTSDKLVYLFGRVIPQLSLVLSMALRYVPMLKRQAKKIHRAQKAMGLYASESRMDRIRAGLSVVSVLVGWSLENSVELSRSMKARGYGLKGHNHYSNYRFRKRDGRLLAAVALLLAASVVPAVFGYTGFHYYPRISRLNGSFPAALGYASFALLSLLPFLIEVEEALRWNYYKSKI